MVKLLVIADDFTGALDTGVQFRAKGTVLRLITGNRNVFDDLDPETQVLIVDAETRHLTAREAGDIVGSIVEDAVRAGVNCIYKKTDSGLRGNIGSELTAVLKNSGQKYLHFIPAFPAMNRITKNGVHYIDTIPVAQSVFGADPFEPVRFSQVSQIIHSQCETAVVMDRQQRPEAGIVLHNAQTQQDLARIASDLKQSGELKLIAGCAGFASALPELLELEPADNRIPAFVPRLLTICGSVNPITLGQLDAAEAREVPRIRLNIDQKLDNGWLGSPAARAAIHAWSVLAQNHNSMIIECDGLSQPEALEKTRKELGMGLEQMRCRISQTMGSILRQLLDLGLDATLLVTGGDTLMAFMDQIGQNELVPICELTAGVVLSQITYRGHSYNLLSKSGGFGTAELLENLEKLLMNDQKEKIVC